MVPHLHADVLSISTSPSISRGFVAVLASSEEHQFDTDDILGGGEFLGKANLVWQDGALQNIRLGGTTTLEGDLDLRGHRLLNFDLGTRGLDHVEVKDVRTLLFHLTFPLKREINLVCYRRLSTRSLGSRLSLLKPSQDQ